MDATSSIPSPTRLQGEIVVVFFPPCGHPTAAERGWNFSTRVRGVNLAVPGRGEDLSEDEDVADEKKPLVGNGAHEPAR